LGIGSRVLRIGCGVLLIGWIVFRIGCGTGVFGGENVPGGWMYLVMGDCIFGNRGLIGVNEWTNLPMWW